MGSCSLELNQASLLIARTSHQNDAAREARCHEACAAVYGTAACLVDAVIGPGPKVGRDTRVSDRGDLRADEREH